MELRRSDWVLAGEPASVRAARAHVAEKLDGVSRASLDTVVLLTSELVTNAIRHGTGPVQLRLAWDERGVRVEVGDRSFERPVLRRPDHGAPNGRGLLLVDALSRRWGVEAEAGGKFVWFEVAW